MVLYGSLIASGVYLMFFYVPSPATAYGDIIFLQTNVAFGQYIRNTHRWSAHLMVLVVAAHMAKMFYRGAYKSPREFNWVVGLVLLILTALLSFTGYLLPWDQLAYWAVTVGTSMADFVPFIGATVQAMLLGGSGVGAPTLLRFYVLHVAVLVCSMTTTTDTQDVYRPWADVMPLKEDSTEWNLTASRASPARFATAVPDTPGL